MSAGTDDRLIVGIGLKVASVAVLMAMSSLVKVATETVPAGEIVFFRSLFAVPPIIAWLWWRGDLATGLKVASPVSHLLRGAIGCTAMALMFTGLGLLPLPEVTAIAYAAPVIVTVMAAIFLGERIRAWRIGAVLFGFAGVLVIMSPRLAALGTGPLEGEALGAIALLACTVFMAAATCIVRSMVHREESSAIVFWFSISCTVYALLTVPFGWVMPSPSILAVLVGAGILGGIGQILLTESFRHGDAGVISPFEYSSLLFSLAIGWFVFGETPVAETYPGAAMVIAAGLVILWRERRAAAERQGRSRERSDALTRARAVTKGAS
ncbi:MAG: DMT family transporter [Pseudomonadota bacterium]